MFVFFPLEHLIYIAFIKNLFMLKIVYLSKA